MNLCIQVYLKTAIQIVDPVQSGSQLHFESVYDLIIVSATADTVDAINR